MELLDPKFIMEIMVIIFGAGGAYIGIKKDIASFRVDFDMHRVDFLTWRQKLEKTLFGDDGRNGLVGDSIVHGEHIKRCKEAMNFHGDRHG